MYKMYKIVKICKNLETGVFQVIHIEMPKKVEKPMFLKNYPHYPHKKSKKRGITRDK